MLYFDACVDRGVIERSILILDDMKEENYRGTMEICYCVEFNVVLCVREREVN